MYDPAAVALAVASAVTDSAIADYCCARASHVTFHVCDSKAAGHRQVARDGEEDKDWQAA